MSKTSFLVELKNDLRFFFTNNIKIGKWTLEYGLAVVLALVASWLHTKNKLMYFVIFS